MMKYLRTSLFVLAMIAGGAGAEFPGKDVLGTGTLEARVKTQVSAGIQDKHYPNTPADVTKTTAPTEGKSIPHTRERQASHHKSAHRA